MLKESNKQKHPRTAAKIRLQMKKNSKILIKANKNQSRNNLKKIGPNSHKKSWI